MNLNTKEMRVKPCETLPTAKEMHKTTQAMPPHNAETI